MFIERFIKKLQMTQFIKRVKKVNSILKSKCLVHIVQQMLIPR